MAPEATKDAETGEILLAEVGRRLGLAPQGLTRFCVMTDAPARNDGRNWHVQWPQFARFRERVLIADAVERVQPNQLEHARTRKELAAAQREEIALAVEMGDAISVQDAGKAWGNMLDLIRTRLLAMPPRVAKLMGGGEAKRAKEATQSVVHGVLKELADDHSDVLAAVRKVAS